MFRSLSWFALAFVGAIVLNATGQSPVLLLATLVASLIVLWRVMRCPHPAPHGFLPPSVDQSGRMRPARWFCQSCGDTWPAELADERQRIRRR